jgi:hypothetical protein
MSHRSWSAQLVVPTPTRAAVAAAFHPVMEALRARGFARSELINLHLKRLSATTVIAGGVAVRRKTDGQELERAGVVYLLHKASAGWQFATVVIHDADTRFVPSRCDAADRRWTGRGRRN